MRCSQRLTSIDHAEVKHTDTGIGKALAKKLARQGLNIVLVALNDPLLDATTTELQKLYPKVELRKVSFYCVFPGIKAYFQVACIPRQVITTALTGGITSSCCGY